MSQKYCNSLEKYSRFKTREVLIGNIGIGGNNPIRIQSMTTTNTMNTEETVNECIRLIHAGCELIRITAPSIKESKNLRNIKDSLLTKGYNTPIIADIHYTPNAAEIAAEIVEKVRINPGNYVDKKRFKKIEYSDQDYFNELKKIELRFLPLVNICKKHNTAMRIGTNHGSLSDRILSRYGDTALGMVESAMEFVRICHRNNYHQIILSMKSSNPKIMIQAYRLLVNQMLKEKMNYPIHLGVTEAGDGNQGRVKSAVGIGALLEDGIGDTIRVSLTEPPENEIPVAKHIIKHIYKRNIENNIKPIINYKINPFKYLKRKTNIVSNIGGSNVPIVLTDLSFKKIKKVSLFNLGYKYSVKLDKWHISDRATDYIYLGENKINFTPPGNLGLVYNYKLWKEINQGYPFFSFYEYMNSEVFHPKINFIYCVHSDITPSFINKIKSDLTVVLIIGNISGHMTEQRSFFVELINKNIYNPVIINRTYDNNISSDQLKISGSIDVGSLLCDGLGDGIMFSSFKNLSPPHLNNLAFSILQSTRNRISKTEYISCPSCGRTLFDLQETTEKIRNATSHLKGLKIGIMGCIVNGPGEMADADYGYVGSGKDKITLYKGHEIIKKNVPTINALDELIQLIKDNGDWKFPQ